MRFLKKPLAQVGSDGHSQARGDVCSFLEYVYDSIAETLPDFRDELGGCHGVEINASDPRQMVLNSQSLEDTDLRPKTKQRKTKRQVELNLDRTVATREEKFLPPGTMKEYWEQYRAQSTLLTPASFACFWRAACQFDRGQFCRGFAHGYDFWESMIFGVAQGWFSNSGLVI